MKAIKSLCIITFLGCTSSIDLESANKNMVEVEAEALSQIPFDPSNKEHNENKKDVYAMEMNRISYDEYFGDPLTNHTLEDEFIKVEIGTNTTSPSFGSVISIQMKFSNPDKFSDVPIYS